MRREWCKPGVKPVQCPACGGVGMFEGKVSLVFQGPAVHARSGNCGDRSGLNCKVPVDQVPVTLRVPVPLGMTDGYRLRVDGEGHEGRWRTKRGPYIVISHSA